MKPMKTKAAPKEGASAIAVCTADVDRALHGLEEAAFDALQRAASTDFLPEALDYAEAAVEALRDHKRIGDALITLRSLIAKHQH